MPFKINLLWNNMLILKIARLKRAKNKTSNLRLYCISKEIWLLNLKNIEISSDFSNLKSASNSENFHYK